jgi:hypothetical protein
MRSIYLQTMVLICLLAGCQKNNTNSSNNGNGNGGGGGSSDSLSVSGWSPLYPYTSDEVTLNGTGFNPDKTKDTVLVEYPGRGGGQPATINSATATQLKIVVPPDSVFGLGYILFPTYTFSILANGKKLDLPLAKTPIFKESLHLSGIGGGEYDVAARPGDTILIRGTGFTPNGNSISIGGNTVNIYNVDTAKGELDNNQSRYDVYLPTCLAHGVIPRTFFGEINDETATKDLTVSFTNGDGKTSQVQQKLGQSPVMLINSITPVGATFTPGYGYSYSLSGLNSTGGNASVQIVGKFLKNNMDVEITGTLTGTNTVVSDAHSSPSVAGFPDSTVVAYNASGLTAGVTYEIRIWANNRGQGNIFYGSQTFFIKQ